MKKTRQTFIPCTMARSIGNGVFFRPIRSWHSATYAGEKLTTIVVNKFSAIRDTVDGVNFASKKEARRYGELKLLQKAGAISGLTLQQTFDVPINGIKCFTYRADFTYIENGKLVIEDAKGFRTALYKLKRRCVEACYGVKIVET